MEHLDPLNFPSCHTSRSSFQIKKCYFGGLPGCKGRTFCRLHSSLLYRVMHLRPTKFQQFTVNYFDVMTCFVDGRAPLKLTRRLNYFDVMTCFVDGRPP